MSSTNRGGTRNESDFYETAPWISHRLIEELQTSAEVNFKGRWLEPCAGSGEIIRAINQKCNTIDWSIGELRDTMRSSLEPLTQNPIYFGDFLEVPEDFWGSEKCDVSITNPPFSLALPIVKKSLTLARRTIMLLRLNFWGSAERAEWLRTHPADTYVLPNRPMFSLNKQGKPGTDSPEYAWMVWRSEEDYASGNFTHGRIKVLGQTPIEERKAWAEELKRRLLPRETEVVCE